MRIIRELVVVGVAALDLGEACQGPAGGLLGLAGVPGCLPLPTGGAWV